MPQIDLSNWAEFQVGELFEIVNGKGVTRAETARFPGDLIAVQSSAENNGVIGYLDRNYCESKDYAIVDEPCLTVARSGSVGYISYQPDSCVIGDSAKALIPHNKLSRESFLYMRAVLTQLRKRYSYGDKVTKERYAADVLMLPVTRFGNPNWEYMDNYMNDILKQAQRNLSILTLLSSSR